MYIRFKDIPDNEISGIYDGDCGRIGNELGTSCYKAIKNYDNNYQIILPSLSEGVLYDLLDFIRDHMSGEIPIYLIDGDPIGVGTYNDPILKNITILKELKILELKDPKSKFKIDKTNPQFVEI